jgi:hypothetical protein
MLGLLLAALILSAAFLTPACNAQENAATVTIQQVSSPNVLNSTYSGLSYEKDILTNLSTANPRFVSALSPNNTALIDLYTMLGSSIVRLGGNSADTLIWVANGPGKVPGQLSPSDITPLAGFLQQTNWKVIYALNLGTGTPAQAAAEAAYVSSALGSSLLGFEIGNEAGAYCTNGLRPSTYTFADYAAQWSTFAQAILSEVPTATLIGPADTSFTAPFIATLGSQASLITHHYYDGLPQANNLPALLNPDTYLDNTTLPNINSLTNAVPVSYRIGEANAFVKSPSPANMFAEALWGIDYAFTTALDHSTGVNFHAVVGEAPIDTDTLLGTVANVNPLFYGMKLFSMAANGRLVSTVVSAQQGNLSAYAVAATNGTTYVVLNNKDTNPVNATINFMQPVVSAQAMVLTAPSLTSSTGVTLGGVPIGVDGSWNSPVTSPVAIANGAATFSVPAGSAALITSAPLTTSIGVPYAGLCADGSTIASLQQSTCSSTSQGQAFAFVPTPNGFFNIVPQNSNLCLDWVNTNQPVKQNPCSNTATQKWAVQQNPDSTYTIIGSGGQYCLNVHDSSTADGTTLESWFCDDEPNEHFYLSNPPYAPLQTATSLIDVSYDGQCIDLKWSIMQPGPYIRQHTCNGTNDQTWSLSSTTDGFYTIASAQSLLCIDGAVANAPVNQNPCSGSSSQKWKLLQNSDSTYTFAGDGSQLCLGIPNASTEINTQLTPYACDGGPDQKFKLPTPPPIL